MSHVADQAAELFSQGFNCAQAVLASFVERMGRGCCIERSAAFHVAQGFGGGMGRTGQTCGAITGAIMAIGLTHGMTDPARPAQRDIAYRLVGELFARFKQRHGSIGCHELIGLDLSTPAGLAEFRAKGLAASHCRMFVHDAADILDQLLAESATP